MIPPPVPKAGIPRWVWILTVCGVIFILGVYVAIFWGYRAITAAARGDMQKANPDFEMLYIANQGKIKVRHNPSGKEFLVNLSAGKRRIPLRGLATKPVIPGPAWLRLPDAAPYAQAAGWDRAGDSAALLEALEVLLAGRGFLVESQEQSTLTACNPKVIECVVVGYGAAAAAPAARSWYNASYFQVP